MNASREALLTAYAALIRKWNPAINLVSPMTVAELEHRHIADSLQLSDLAPPNDTWLDIGSGGGLPAIVVAICEPARHVTLVDSDRRKVTFLQAVIRELGLPNCRAIASRIEALPPAGVRHLSARALAPLPRLVPYLDRHLAADGTAWLMKGRNWQTELNDAGPDLPYSVTVHASVTDPSAAILELSRKNRG